jgi:DNA-binding NarL/FixJ family response regulator
LPAVVPHDVPSASTRKAVWVRVKLKILLVDDNSVIRHLLRAFLESNTDWSVCGEAENGRVGIDKVVELHPNVVILDFSMPVMNGLDAAREIARIAPTVVTFLFTMHNSEQLQMEAKTVGIREVVSKSDRFQEQLLASLEIVSASL